MFRMLPNMENYNKILVDHSGVSFGSMRNWEDGESAVPSFCFPKRRVKKRKKNEGSKIGRKMRKGAFSIFLRLCGKAK